MNYQRRILEILNSQCTDSEFQWIKEKLNQDAQKRRLGFVMAHRFVSSDLLSTGKIGIDLSPYSIDLKLWSRDQLARALLLLSLDDMVEKNFHSEIENLFMTADNRESQALYASIPLFNYPESWNNRATEAIRSNVGHIFDAMAFNNPYPAMYFDEMAWNQIVLKTIFSDKSIWRITGLEERRNEKLARSISEFAHERWAAGRQLPAEVWYLTAPYQGTRFWEDVDRLLSSDNPDDQKAGYLLWRGQSAHAPDYIYNPYKETLKGLEQKEVNWKNLANAITST